MAVDPRFFSRTGPHALRDVAQVAGGELSGDDGRALGGIAPLQSAAADEVSFLDNRRYADLLASTRAGAVIVHPDLRHRVPPGCAAIVTTQPYVGWARVATLFHPLPAALPGIHPSAVIDASARIDPSVEVGPLAVVAAGAEIGPRCRIGPLAVLGAGVVLGADCRIGPHASVSHAILGERVYVYAGARIGQDGFGFATTKQGLLTVPHVGRVLLGDDVEVGANSAVDRGSTLDTVIGAGSRLDNLVQIGHNVQLGRCCVVVSQAGISGSTVLGDFVVIGGQAGLAGHLHIGAGARLGGQAGVMTDVPPGAEFLGSPALPVRAFFRQVATLRRLAEGGRATAKPAATRMGTD